MKIMMMAAAAALAVAACSCSGSKSESAEAQETAAAVADTVAAPVAEVVIAVDTVGYTTTPSGLKYKEITPGKGKTPKPTDTVSVNYTGKHMDGTKFDSNLDHGTEPATFPLNRVIPGWTEGVGLMKEGAKYQFLIPSKLAYGEQGTPGGPIGPNEDLYFEVELLEVQ